MRAGLLTAAALAATLIGWPALAQQAPAAAGVDDSGELAKTLANPVSSMISVPLQWNYDCCFGPSEGARALVNVQPVIPVSLTENWNVVVRTIVPIVLQESPSVGVKNAFGLSDIQQSFFFTPAKPKSGLILAVGPIVQYPTGSSQLGSEKWGLGPTVLILKQTGGRTVGLLANHVWSVAGDEDRADVDRTFLQPIFSYTTPTGMTYSLNSETTYDWVTKKWSIPINASIARIYKVGQQRVQLAGGFRWYVDGEEEQPNWGVRVTTTFLFPK